MRAVLAAALPVLPHASWAIDYDHILVNDPSGSSEIFLRPGDTVTNADQLTGLGAAVDVSVAGNSVHAEGVTISTSRPNDGNLLANPVGVRATGGGTVTLLDSTVTTEGDRSRGGHALYAEDAGSAITATDSAWSPRHQCRRRAGGTGRPRHTEECRSHHARRFRQRIR